MAVPPIELPEWRARMGRLLPRRGLEQFGDFVEALPAGDVGEPVLAAAPVRVGTES